jgi:hypothetical protein
LSPRPRRIQLVLGLAGVLAVTFPTLAHPIVYRNGDGAWFNWINRWEYPCNKEVEIDGLWLDVTLGPDQGGIQTPVTIERNSGCVIMGCDPSFYAFRASSHVSLLVDPVPWIFVCCSTDEIYHAPEPPYGFSISPDLTWSDAAYGGYEYCRDARYSRPIFLGVRLVMPDTNQVHYGWVLNDRRCYPSPGDPDGTWHPTAWAFETEPDTPIPTPPCAADVDFNFQVDFFDYLQFVQDFDAGHWIANFEFDDQLDFFDYLAFLDAYASCP